MHYPVTARTRQPSQKRVHSGKAFVLFLFLCVYLSYILFFDLRILTARLGVATPELSQLLLIWGGGLAPFILYFLLSIRLTKSNYFLLGILSIYSATGLILGFVFENPFTDVVGDFYKSLFIPAGMGLYFAYRRYGDFVERSLYWIGAVFVLARTIGFIVTFGSLSRLYYGTSMDALIVLLALKGFSRDFAGKSTTKLAKARKIFVIAAALIGQKRSVALAFLIYLVHRHKRLLAVVSVVAITAFTYLDLVDWRNLGFIGRYLSVTDTSFIVESQSMRVNEVLTAFAAWTSGAIAFLLGHGFGAEILVYTGRGDYAEWLHSLHNTPMAVAYRSGLLGMVLLAYLVRVAASDILVKNRGDGAIIFALFAASFFFFSFIDEIFVGYYAAKILENSNSKNTGHT